MAAVSSPTRASQATGLDNRDFAIRVGPWQDADRPQQPVLFVNPHSGGGKAARARLAERARERGVDVVVLRADNDLAEIAAAAVGGADALGVAGGDGSLAVVAAVALAHGIPFVCVPAGTRNHFASDVGVDRGDLVGSLDAFGDGVERRIDVAEVNGRLFLNNVSLGIYGDAVREVGYRDAKTRTLLQTAARVLGPSGRATGAKLVDDLGRSHRNPAVVLISNNPYAFDPPHLPGTRPRLDSGQLGVFVLAAPRAGERGGFRWHTPYVQVVGTAPVSAGVDGEAVELTPPLEFVIRPAALRVRVSRRHASHAAPRRTRSSADPRWNQMAPAPDLSSRLTTPSQ